MKNSIEDVQRYWNSHLNLTQFLDDSSSSRVGSPEFYQSLLRSLERFEYKHGLLEELARHSKGKKLLEVGCGLGVELAMLGKAGGDVTGIDLAPTVVGLCNQHLRSENVQGRALVQNAEEMSFEDGTFDVVYSSGVLQHTPDINKAVAEIRRVLKDGGRILIILYHRHSWFYLLHKLSRVNIEFESQDAPIINTYTRKDLRELFGKFRDLRIRSEHYRPKPTTRRGSMAVLYNKLFVPLANRIPEVLIRRFGWHLVLIARK